MNQRTATAPECSSTRCGGFTLLEIVLALALLAGALAALGEVLSLARQNARSTQDETEASLRAESVMAELLAGSREFEELLLVRMTVQQKLPDQQRPARVRLARWVLHPDFVAERESALTTEIEEEDDEEDATD